MGEQDGMEHEFEYARQTLEIERYRLMPHERCLRERVAEGDNKQMYQELSLIRLKIVHLETAIWKLQPEIPPPGPHVFGEVANPLPIPGGIEGSREATMGQKREDHAT